MTQSDRLIPEPGAPSALKAIAEEEAQARAHRDDCLQVFHNAQRDAITRPPEKDGTDWDRLETVAKRHLDDAESRLTDIRKLLLSYDKSVAPEKRDSSEKIMREEAENIFRNAFVYKRQAVMSLSSAYCGSVLTCRSQEEVHKLMADKLVECEKNAWDSAVREKHVPTWVGKCIEGLL